MGLYGCDRTPVDFSPWAIEGDDTNDGADDDTGTWIMAGALLAGEESHTAYSGEGPTRRVSAIL